MRVWDAADYSVITSVTVRDAGAPTSLSYTLGENDILIYIYHDLCVLIHIAIYINICRFFNDRLD